jgi:agmatinase
MNQTPFDPAGAAPEDSGIFGLPHGRHDAGVLLVPVPWDATTSYRPGTADGPRAIVKASRQVDLFDLETGRPYEAGIHMLEESTELRSWNKEARAAAVPIIQAGGVIAGDAALEASLQSVNAMGSRLNETVRALCEGVLEENKVLGLVGGDHSTPYGAIAAVAARWPGVGILHLDAHADLRVAYEGFRWSHASIMWNVFNDLSDVSRIVQVGIRDFCEEEYDVIRGSEGRVITHFMADIVGAHFQGETWAARCGRIVDELPKQVYISFDIDGLDPVYCPHTGTPVPGGLGFHEAAYLIGAVARSGRTIVAFDLNEVAPGPKGDQWDGNVGARMLYKMIGWALKSR